MSPREWDIELGRLLLRSPPERAIHKERIRLALRTADMDSRHSPAVLRLYREIFGRLTEQWQGSGALCVGLVGSSRDKNAALRLLRESVCVAYSVHPTNGAIQYRRIFDEQLPESESAHV